MNDILESVARLDLQDSPPSLSPTALPINDIMESVARLDLLSSPPLRGLNTLPAKSPCQPLSPSKRDCDHKSEKVVRYLQNMRRRIFSAKEKLSAPSHETLCEVETEVATIRLALGKITRRSDTLDKDKEAVFEELERLQARLIEWRLAIPDTQQGPIVFDASKFSHNHTTLT
jgi:hypothetical protein